MKYARRLTNFEKKKYFLQSFANDIKFVLHIPGKAYLSRKNKKNLREKLRTKLQTKWLCFRFLEVKNRLFCKYQAGHVCQGQQQQSQGKRKGSLIGK